MEDTECIVAKAIRDGGIDAVLDHGASCMLSKDTPDVYATAEPAAAFHARVAFCLDIHNEVRLPLSAVFPTLTIPIRPHFPVTSCVVALLLSCSCSCAKVEGGRG